MHLRELLAGVAEIQEQKCILVNGVDVDSMWHGRTPNDRVSATAEDALRLQRPRRNSPAPSVCPGLAGVVAELVAHQPQSPTVLIRWQVRVGRSLKADESTLSR